MDRLDLHVRTDVPPRLSARHSDRPPLQWVVTAGPRCHPCGAPRLAARALWLMVNKENALLAYWDHSESPIAQN